MALSQGCRPQQVTLRSDLSIGSAFPELEGEDLDGNPISMADFRGKVILVDFFGDW
jgi:peroxiredoxin